MSTLQGPTPRRDRTHSRFEIALGALGALIAIGVLTLFLALTGAHQTATPTSIPARPQAASAALTASPSGGYFRDPTTHAFLNVRTEGCDAAQLRVEKSCARP